MRIFILLIATLGLTACQTNRDTGTGGTSGRHSTSADCRRSRPGYHSLARGQIESMPSKNTGR